MLSRIAALSGRSSSRLGLMTTGVRSLSSSSSSAAIEVNHVVRNTKCKVAGEDDAVAMDALFRKACDSASGLPGFVSAQRIVCKAEWDYECTIVFEAAHFGGYMESDVREKEILPILEEAKGLAVNGHIHSQNFVFDTFAGK